MPDPWADACAAGVAVLVGGGYSSDGDAYTVQGVGRPVPTDRPVLTALTPATMAAADPDTTLSCQGSGFTRDCAIAFAGRLERTDFISDTELSTVVTGDDHWAPGTQPVQVVADGRGSSDSQTFTFT